MPAITPGPDADTYAAYPILIYFKWEHLKPELQEVSRPFAELAWAMARRGSLARAEVAAGLRKLLEAKDCAVRAALV